MALLSEFPKQIKFIVGNEAAERFSFYGMRSILVVFMVQHLGLAQHDSKAVFHLFVGACYLLPLFGGFLSDRYLGKYKTILYLSLFYCVGHGVLAVWESEYGLYAGLALISLGAGGIKPCVSAHVGDQFTEKNQHLVKKVFDIFYWSVNFGSSASTLLIPWLLVNYGSRIAFGIPGVLMAIATFVFWLGRKHYVHVPPTRVTGAVGFLPIFSHALTKLGSRKKGESFLDVAKNKFKAEDVEAVKAAWGIIKVFATVTVFWALFDQHSSSWILQAEQMNRNLFGFQMQSSQIAAMNPLMVMVLIPIFSVGVYPTLEKLGFRMTPLRRMSVGMVVAAFSFVGIAIIQHFLDGGQSVNVGWQFFPYLIITAAEVMISITGLEFAYTQAPRAMKSTIMSFWYLTVWAGNVLTAYISKINVFKGASFFYFFAALMFAVSFIFIFSARRYKERKYFEKA